MIRRVDPLLKLSILVFTNQYINVYREAIFL